MDVVYGGAMGPDGAHHMKELTEETREWLSALGIEPENEALWIEALTHGSRAAPRNYERLEFLGDRVLGLAMADWLFHQTDAPEGALSQRMNALVSRQTCARVAKRIGLGNHILMGKQAREDGGRESTNILGDVIEALLGASFLERGFAASYALVKEIWAEEFSGGVGDAKHPKSALQEWAAGNRHKPPEYELLGRSGPDHAAHFTVRVSVKNVGSAEAEASSKHQAERLAALAFMEQFG